MKKLKISFTQEQYIKLRDFFRMSQLEQIGTMYGNTINNEIIINQINIYTQDLIKSQSADNVIIMGKTIVNDMINAKKSGADVFISMHTHPSLNGIALLSESDKKELNFESNLLKHPSMKMLAIEGVITIKEMNFFFWDDKKNDVKRVEWFINEKKEDITENNNKVQYRMNKGKHHQKNLKLVSRN